jgi:hypothetical protein
VIKGEVPNLNLLLLFHSVSWFPSEMDQAWSMIVNFEIFAQQDCTSRDGASLLWHRLGQNSSQTLFDLVKSFLPIHFQLKGK